MPGFVRNIWFLTIGVTLLAVVMLGLTMWHSVEKTLVQAVELQNHTLVYSIRQRFGNNFLAQLVRLSKISLRSLQQDQESRRINENLRALTTGRSLFRINTYSPHGGMLLSSAPELIGADRNLLLKPAEETQKAYCPVVQPCGPWPSRWLNRTW